MFCVQLLNTECYDLGRGRGRKQRGHTRRVRGFNRTIFIEPNVTNRNQGLYNLTNNLGEHNKPNDKPRTQTIQDPIRSRPGAGVRLDDRRQRT